MVRARGVWGTAKSAPRAASPRYGLCAAEPDRCGGRIGRVVAGSPRPVGSRGNQRVPVPGTGGSAGGSVAAHHPIVPAMPVPGVDAWGEPGRSASAGGYRLRLRVQFVRVVGWARELVHRRARGAAAYRTGDRIAGAVVL